MYILLKVGGRLGNSKPLFSLGLHHWTEPFSDIGGGGGGGGNLTGDAEISRNFV